MMSQRAPKTRGRRAAPVTGSRSPPPGMPGFVKAYVRYVDAMNRVIGRIVMYGLFAMMAILLYSSISKAFLLPAIWTLEMAQFSMVAYFLLGGAYSIQQGAHVRMDLVYGTWSDRTKAVVDAFTVLFLIFFLVMLLYGGYSSTEYALQYEERSYSAWRPLMAPIKIIMSIGIFLTLLQAISAFFKDLAKATGRSLG
jgi:TRAP-type mannitol/chloroaromatic compound transport system permease small subunit